MPLNSQASSKVLGENHMGMLSPEPVVEYLPRHRLRPASGNGGFLSVRILEGRNAASYNLLHLHRR